MRKNAAKSSFVDSFTTAEYRMIGQTLVESGYSPMTGNRALRVIEELIEPLTPYEFQFNLPADCRKASSLEDLKFSCHISGPCHLPMDTVQELWEEYEDRLFQAWMNAQK